MDNSDLNASSSWIPAFQNYQILSNLWKITPLKKAEHGTYQTTNHHWKSSLCFFSKQHRKYWKYVKMLQIVINVAWEYQRWMNPAHKARHCFHSASGVLVSWLYVIVFSGVTAQNAVSYDSSLALSFWSIYSLWVNSLVACLNMGVEWEEDRKRQIFLDEKHNFELKGTLQLSSVPVPDAILVLDHGPLSSKPGM